MPWCTQFLSGLKRPCFDSTICVRVAGSMVIGVLCRGRMIQYKMDIPRDFSSPPDYPCHQHDYIHSLFALGTYFSEDYSYNSVFEFLAEVTLQSCNILVENPLITNESRNYKKNYVPKLRFGKRVFWKTGLFIKVHFLEILASPQTVENKGESDDFYLEILETLEIPGTKRPLS